MKKKSIFFLILVVFFIIAGIVAFYIYSNNKNNNTNNTNNSNAQNTIASRTSTNVNEEQSENRITNIISNQDEIIKKSEENTQKEIATFSTQIKDRSAGRLTNIQITCSTLTGTIIHPGETFSFNDTVGKPTAARGYQEASVIIDGKTEKGIGGGNCQVSSTLYNALLIIPSLVVTERHEHGKDVTYVPDGKDAAVSYGGFDLKFRNDTGKSIQINAGSDDYNVLIKIIEL